MSVILFVLDLPEFAPLLHSASASGGCTVMRLDSGYWKIEAPKELRFQRKQLRLGPALWNCALSGGFRGHLAAYDRDEIRLVHDAS